MRISVSNGAKGRKVSVFRDGHKVMSRAKSVFKVRVNVRGLSRGVHTVRVQVRGADGVLVTKVLRFRRC
jgi:YbbR domain-containing protein